MADLKYNPNGSQCTQRNPTQIMYKIIKENGVDGD